MSWLDRSIITEEEATTKRLLPKSQFAAGEPVLIILNDIGSDEDDDAVPGIVTGVRFDADQVRYCVAFKIQSTSMYVVLKDLRTEMIRMRDGEKTSFFTSDEVEAIVRRMPANLRVVEDGEDK